MKTLAVLLALAVAFPAAASKGNKHKDETVAITNLGLAKGRYVGIDPGFIVELKGSGGMLHSQKGTAALSDITLDRGELRANVGGQPFHATFVTRIVNGKSAFGLVVHKPSVRLDGDVVLSDLFCRLQ